jgi:hypothetical protein
MRRLALLPATVVLLALTAASLLAAFVALRPPAPAAIGGTAADANRATVRRFYEAINEALLTGNTKSVTALLTTDYEERDATDTAAPGRQALDSAVRGLRLIAPGLRLELVSLVADGDCVVALVRSIGFDPARFLSLSLTAPAVWPPVDVFRLENGRIAERLGAGERPLVVEPIASQALDLVPVTQQIVTLQRTALPPATSLRAEAVNGLRVLVVEAGILSIDVGTLDRRGAPTVTADTRSLDAGTSLVIPAQSRYEAGNHDGETALLLEVQLTSPSRFSSFGDPSDDPAPAGVTTTVLAGGAPSDVGPTPLLSVGRVTLAPGASLAWDGPAGAVLLVVEAGRLGLEIVGDQSAWLRRGRDGRAFADDRATLGAGDGALFPRSAGAEVGNTGAAPVVLTVLTLIDVEPPG